jgi:hypothetical protein
VPVVDSKSAAVAGDVVLLVVAALLFKVLQTL